MISVSENNTHIEDSYKITKNKVMYNILNQIRISNIHNRNLAIFNRSLKSMIIEWRAHNLLYKLHICRERTRNVDLNLNEPLYKRISYYIFHMLYYIV